MKIDCSRQLVTEGTDRRTHRVTSWAPVGAKKDSDKLERVQKSAAKVILVTEYINYTNALDVLRLQSLEERRKFLCLKFAKKCQEVDKLKSMFPKKRNLHCMPKRYCQKFIVRDTWTERHKKSAIPFMQNLLNNEDKKKKDILKQISNFKPVNNGFL